MMCPNCKHPRTKVVDSRQTAYLNSRRRECCKCGARFSTKEILVSGTVLLSDSDKLTNELED